MPSCFYSAAAVPSSVFSHLPESDCAFSRTSSMVPTLKKALTAAITDGEVVFTLPDGSKIPCAVTQGMIDVSAARVRVLCDSALHPDEINAEAERKQAEAAALKLREKLGHRDYVLSKLTFAKATNHLRVKQHNS